MRSSKNQAFGVAIVNRQTADKDFVNVTEITKLTAEIAGIDSKIRRCCDERY